MVRSALVLLASFLCLGTGAAFAAPPASAPLEVLAAEFGIFEEGKSGELTLVPSTTVPHREGQRYGWVIEIRTTQRSVAVREEYLLTAPAAAPAGDPLSESLREHTQRRNQVSQRQLQPVGGVIYGEWAVGPQEPPGPRRLQVLIEGQLAASFAYEVRELR